VISDFKTWSFFSTKNNEDSLLQTTHHKTLTYPHLSGREKSSTQKYLGWGYVSLLQGIWMFPKIVVPPNHPF